MTLRADAARNRQQIVDAAHASFAADGTEVSMAEIARRAGVGIATVLRRFPTKDALLEAVLEPIFLRFEATMNDVLAEHDDPWEALEIPMRELCRLQVAEPGLSAALALALGAAAPSETCARIGHRLDDVLAEARRRGRARSDATIDDLVLIVLSVAGVITAGGDDRADPVGRVTDLLLESLRGTGR